MLLLEVPHHLVELFLRDLSTGVSGPQDRVGVLAVSPVAPVAVPPAPAAPPAHAPEEEEEQQEEDPAEAEREERVEAHAGPPATEGERDQRGGDRDADHNEQERESPADPTTRMVLAPSRCAHARPPPSATARKRSAIFRMPSRYGPNFDASEVFRSSKYDTNPSISLTISSTPRARLRPTPATHSNPSRTSRFSSYRPSSRFWTSSSCCSSATSR